MSVIELISLGCSLVSVTTDVAPFIKKLNSKESRRKDVKKSLRSESRQLQEEYDSDDTRLGPRYAREEEIGSDELKDLIKAQSQLISNLHLMLGSGPGKNDSPYCMSEDSRMHSVPALVDQAQCMPLEPSVRAFSFSASNRTQHRALGSPPSRASSFSTPNPSYRMPLETPLPRAVSFPISNDHRRESLPPPPLRASSLSIPNSSQNMSFKTPLPRAVSFPLSNDHQRGSLPPPLRASSFPIIDSPPSVSSETPLPRAVTFPLSNQHRRESLGSPPKPSSFPMPDQWRKSLKTPSRASSISSPMPSELQSCPSPRSSTSSKISRPSSFHELLDLDQLPQLLPYLNNTPIQHLIHHALEWSYPQTLDQLLHPDQFYLKGDAVMRRSYLSLSVRSYIYILAYTTSSSSDSGLPTQRFALTIFLIRFVMYYGVDVLRDAPFQYNDSTGLREVDSSYEMAREILRFLKEK